MIKREIRKAKSYPTKKGSSKASEEAQESDGEPYSGLSGRLEQDSTRQGRDGLDLSQ